MCIRDRGDYRHLISQAGEGGALWQGGEHLRNREIVQVWRAENDGPAAVGVARRGEGGVGGGGEQHDGGDAERGRCV